MENTAERLEEKQIKVHVSLFRKEKVSYSLTLFAIIAELVYVIGILDVMNKSYWMGITVMVNILMLFLMFTCAVKMNVYDKKWAFIALVVAVYLVIRQLVLVPIVLQPYDRQLLIAVSNFVGAALMAFSGIICIDKSEKRRKLQIELGNNREK